MQVLGYGGLSWVPPTFTKAERFQGVSPGDFPAWYGSIILWRAWVRAFFEHPDMVSLLPILILPVSHSAYLMSDENQYSLHPMDRDASEVREILQ